MLSMMACRLYQAIHQAPLAQVPTSDSTNMLRQQLSSLPSLPATQPSFALPTMPHTVALQQPIALPLTQQPASLSSMQQPVTLLLQPSTASLQPPPPSVLMQLPVTSLTQQPTASLQPLPPSILDSTSGSPDLALLLINLTTMRPPHKLHFLVRRHLQPSHQLPLKAI